MFRLRGRTNKWEYWWTLVSGFVETLFIAGISYGWASLVFVLKLDGYFSGYCVNVTREEDDTVFADCSRQDEHFTRIMTIALFTNIITRFPVGLVFDSCGTAVTRIIAICLFTFGTLSISMSNADTPFLLYPALPCLITSGSIFYITNLQVGNLFDSRRSIIITIYSGAYDSSAVVLLFIKLLHEDGVSFNGSFLFLTLCSVGLLLRTLFLMPRGHIPYPLPEDFTYGLGCPSRRRQRVKDEGQTEEITKLEFDKKQKDKRVEASHPSTSLDDPKQEKKACFWSCLFSWLFLWHLVWMVTSLFCHSIYLAQVNPILTQLTDNDQNMVSHYTNVFAFIQMCGVFFAPLIGLIMDRHKHKGPAPGQSKREADLRSSSPALLLTSLQCFLFCVCFTAPVLPLQYLTFVLQVANSTFLYGVHNTFIYIAFPASHFGKLSGVIMSFSGLVLLLQFPIQYLIQTHLHGDPLYANIGVTLVSLLTFCHPLHVSLYCRKLAHRRKTGRLDVNA
ncbi:solute carrier family 43 member 3a isoform X2 [Antennarius striatus]|uniref:solute carrier family 43 member 3a isoform X2 n=1 Tax=Antennarius striatus TaxID=241820 RepID=UPI0035ADBC89